MVVKLDNLYGFAQLETVKIIKVERREVDGKTALVNLAEREGGKTVKFGVLEPALQSFAEHTDEKDGKYVSRVPSEFLSDGKKIRWINAPYS